jgi:hypothetical protein
VAVHRPDKSQHQGRTFHFANAQAKQMFEKAPAKYPPACDGLCATAVAQGMKWHRTRNCSRSTTGGRSNAQAKAMFDKDASGPVRLADQSLLAYSLYGPRPVPRDRGSSLRALGMRDETWGWTIEMQVRAAERGLRTLEVPVDVPSQGGRTIQDLRVAGRDRASRRAMLEVIARLRLTRRYRCLLPRSVVATRPKGLSHGIE